MTIFQAVFLSIFQGVTEFLPISSSGHLVLFQKLFKIAQPPIFFDILLHLGSLIAIIFYFRKEIFDLILNWQKKIKVWILIFIGTLPAVFFGYFLNSRIEEIFNSLSFVGMAWIVFGILLLSTHFLIKKKSLSKNIDQLSIKDGVLVGLFQALALFPGISRSGSTIAGGLLRDFSKETAIKFSFLLSLPAILGATILKLGEKADLNIGVNLCIISVVLSAIVGFYSLKLLKKVLLSDKFYLFGIYCLILGLSVYFYL